MAQNLSNYAEDAILNGTAMPATLYVQLHIGAPGEVGTANPATETDRAAFTRTTASAGTCANVAAITWTGVAAAETYSHLSIWDAASAGNCWWHGPLTTPRAVLAGLDFVIAIGDLDLSMD